MASSETTVAVVGGGITGLCAAWYLRKALGPDAVTLLEASDVTGGVVRSAEQAGFVCDWGPNGFLDREPLMLQWLDDLGVRGETIQANAAAARRFILTSGGLEEILPPPRFFFSPLLPLKGRLRLLAEPFIPPRRDHAGETIYDFAARRIGADAAEWLVRPMVTGVFGGDARLLMLEHSFPRMAAMEREHGGLFRAMLAKGRARRRARKRGEPVTAGSPIGPGGTLTSFPGGVGRIAEAAAAALKDAAVWRKCAAESITGPETPMSGEGWLGSKRYALRLADGGTLRADGVVVAAPAHAAAPVVQDWRPALSKALGAIPYAGMTVVCAGYSRDAVGHSMDGFGFLVPPALGKRVLGCIWTSSLFPAHAPKGSVFLRAMVGGYTDPAALFLTDDDLLDLIRREIHPLLRINGEPEFFRVFRHAHAIPQYIEGHGARLRTIEESEEACPGLAFAGNAYRGVGMNDCVVSARRAVDRLMAHAGG